MTIDISKLKRYKPGYVHSNDGPAYLSMLSRADGEYVRLDDVMALAALSSHRQAGDAFDWIIEITGNPAYPVRITEPAGVNAWEPHASSLGAKFILAVKKLLTAPPPGADLSKFRELAERWLAEDARRHSAPTELSGCADDLIALVEKGAGNG